MRQELATQQADVSGRGAARVMEGVRRRVEAEQRPTVLDPMNELGHAILYTCNAKDYGNETVIDAMGHALKQYMDTAK